MSPTPISVSLALIELYANAFLQARLFASADGEEVLASFAMDTRIELTTR